MNRADAIVFDALIAERDAAIEREARLRAAIDRVLPADRDPANDEPVIIDGYGFWAIRNALATTPEGE